MELPTTVELRRNARAIPPLHSLKTLWLGHTGRGKEHGQPINFPVLTLNRRPWNPFMSSAVSASAAAGQPVQQRCSGCSATVELQHKARTIPPLQSLNTPWLGHTGRGKAQGQSIYFPVPTHSGRTWNPFISSAVSASQPRQNLAKDAP